jgi:hypothetical protein
MVNVMTEKTGKLAFRTPKYSVLRVMAVTWHRTVIRKHGQNLVNGLAQVVDECRMAFPKCVPEEDVTLIKKLIESITDISINELSIHFVKHSEFELTGLLSSISSTLLQSTISFYQSLKPLPLSVLLTYLDLDLSLFSNSFISSILNPIKLENLQLRLDQISSYLLSSFDLFSNIPVDILNTSSIFTSSALLSSSISKFLFKSRPSLSIKSKIQNFLSFIQENNENFLINSYNSAQEELENIPSSLDIEINYKTQKILKLLPVEKKFFAFDYDLDYEEFLIISANFSIM